MVGDKGAGPPMVPPLRRGTGIPGGDGLPGEGSNLDCVIQSHVSYH